MGPHERKYDMNHILYRISNRLNGRYYIGMHSTKNIGDGYLGSGLRISHEINKYGKENFERIVLEKFSTRKELAAKERELVNEAMLLDPLCLNLKLGGEGGGKFYSVEHQRKCAAADRTGEKNSQFGTCWISKDGTAIKIKKNNLLEYLQQGYLRGRK